MGPLRAGARHREGEEAAHGAGHGAAQNSLGGGDSDIGHSTHALYADRERKARAVVGNLRSVAGRYPEDARLAALVGELSMASPEFAALWSDHRNKPCEADTYLLRHPLVGEVTVGQQTLVVARTPTSRWY
ncbi:hypothetical protein ACIG56_10030 [Nocardia fusca]|uniref:MmyB family transcriptional regulator n=1 Tax=Nocardia fusca TaxID=941183 RepID=UPI0037C7EBC7